MKDSQFFSSLHKMAVFLLCVMVLAAPTLSAKDNLNKITTKIKTDKKFNPSDIEISKIYAVNVERVSTNLENQSAKCSGVEKAVVILKEEEKFRIGAEVSRAQSVYESLTTLSDEVNGIETFSVLGEHIFLILNNGSAYFLKNEPGFEKNPKQFSININLSIGDSQSSTSRLTPKIAKINGNAFVATSLEIAYCEPSVNACTKLSGYNDAQLINQLYAFIDPESKRQFLIILSGENLHTYELTSQASLTNQQTYTCKDFNLGKCFFVEMTKLAGNKFAILDYYNGLLEVEFEEGEMSKLKKDSLKVLYGQEGCLHMTSQNEANYIALECSLSRKSFFILELTKSQFGDYVTQSPIFFNQALTGISSNNDIVMAHIFSGVRLFWSSSTYDRPYPYDFHKAGTIFLHNSKDSEIGEIKGKKAIYILTEEQLRIYKLDEVFPTVKCYSQVSIEEEYKLKYIYDCNEPDQINHQCSKETTFKFLAQEHKQIEFTRTILPLVVSFILVAAVGYFLFKLHKKYEKDIEQARLKYNTENDFGFETS